MVKIKNGSADWCMFGSISPKLGIIFFEFALLMKRRKVDNLVITSIIRDKSANDTGIHMLGRAVDISLGGISKKIAQEVADIINALYPYGKGKSTVIIHTGNGYKGDCAEHIHLQSNE